MVIAISENVMKNINTENAKKKEEQNQDSKVVFSVLHLICFSIYRVLCQRGAEVGRRTNLSCCGSTLLDLLPKGPGDRKLRTEIWPTEDFKRSGARASVTVRF